MGSVVHNVNILPNIRARGRGTAGVPKSRFDIQTREWLDDGREIAVEAQVIRTFVTEEPAKSAISYNSPPDLPFDRSMHIAAANMGAFIVTRGPLTIIWSCPRALVLKLSFLQKRALLINCAVNWRVQNVRSRQLQLEQILISIRRLKGAIKQHDRYWK